MSYFEEIEESEEGFNPNERLLIPDNTQLRCVIAAVKWENTNERTAEVDGKRYISVSVMVDEKGKYFTQLVDHKLYIESNDVKKKNRALRFLSAYDSLAKGKLRVADKEGREFTDRVLAHALNGTKLACTFRTWEIENMKGNWVESIGKVRQVKEKAHVEEETSEDDITF